MSWKKSTGARTGYERTPHSCQSQTFTSHVSECKDAYHMTCIVIFLKLVCFLFRRTSSWVASRKRSPRRKRCSGNRNEDGSQRNRCKPLWDGARRFLGCFQFWCQNLRCNKMVRVSPNPTRLDVYVLLSSLILRATSQLSGRTSSALWRFAKSLAMKGFGRSFLH